jgi:osmotically-inducible protein OsmY
MEMLAAQSWINSRLISVGVEDGVVMLDGCVTDIRQRDAVGVVAENVPGVVRVDNRLVCIDLNSGVIYFAPEDDPRQPGTQMPHS